MARLKKTVSFEPETLNFLMGYAKSNGGDFAEANEQLVILGASNLEAQKKMNEQYISKLESLINEIKSIEERHYKMENRMAALAMAQIKLSGSVKQMISASMLKQNFTPTEIEMETKRGIKFGIDSIRNSPTSIKDKGEDDD